MKAKTILYWVSTAVLCGIMLYSASMYFAKTEVIKGFFKAFNYPTYIVIPLAILKILGVIVILWRPKKAITEWAYAGFFFDLILATLAHYYANHGVVGFSLYGLLAFIPSYFLGKHLRE